MFPSWEIDDKKTKDDLHKFCEVFQKKLTESLNLHDIYEIVRCMTWIIQKKNQVHDFER